MNALLLALALHLEPTITLTQGAYGPNTSEHPMTYRRSGSSTHIKRPRTYYIDPWETRTYRNTPGTLTPGEIRSLQRQLQDGPAGRNYGLY